MSETTERPRVVHCKREPFDVYIGRPSKWGNPFPIPSKNYDRERDPENILGRYAAWLGNEIAAGRLDPTELRGKTLGCWCAPKRCHGDVLLEVANGD